MDCSDICPLKCVIPLWMVQVPPRKDLKFEEIKLNEDLLGVGERLKRKIKQRK